MRASRQAALCSGLGFPGLGYFYIGQRLRGGIVVALSVGCLLALSVAVFDAARPIAEAIVVGRLAPEIGAVLSAVHEAKGRVMSAAGGAVWALVVLWLFSTVDGYRLGKRLEQQGGSCSE